MFYLKPFYFCTYYRRLVYLLCHSYITAGRQNVMHIVRWRTGRRTAWPPTTACVPGTEWGSWSGARSVLTWPSALQITALQLAACSTPTCRSLTKLCFQLNLSTKNFESFISYRDHPAGMGKMALADGVVAHLAPNKLFRNKKFLIKI